MPRCCRRLRAVSARCSPPRSWPTISARTDKEGEMTVPGIKALAFDTGGTVLDWHTGIRAELAEAGARHGIERDWTAITNAYRRRALQRMTNQTSPGFNIDDVHREVVDELVAQHDLAVFSPAERQAIAGRWHSLDAWPDFPPALERLRRRYVVVSFTILSVALIIDTEIGRRR